MEKTIGIIGCGNMGRAILEGMVKAGFASSDRIYVYDRDVEKTRTLRETLGVHVSESSKQLVEASEVVLLAVKPNIYGPVLEEIKEGIESRHLLVTIAAGVNLAFVEGIVGSDKRIVRTMPNTPALVGAGMTAVCPGRAAEDRDAQLVLDLFGSVGKAERVEESLIDAVIGVSGSSPAYVYMFIEALADGAVLGGMQRETAYRFAAQAVLGSAKMVLESGKHPGALKDMVCSPGGTTIEAVRTLESEGFRGTVMKAVSDCMEKSKKMTK